MREQIKDRGRLEHILSAISNVEKYVKGLTREQFEADQMRTHATCYNIQVIGEASYKLTKEFKKRPSGNAVATHREDATHSRS